MSFDRGNPGATPLPAGSEIELLRPGERQPFAETTVLEASESHLTLGESPFDPALNALTLRWWDENGEAWEIDASVERASGLVGNVALRLLESWRPAVLRRAGRILLGRAPADLVTIGGDGREVRRVHVLCLDLSTTGCRVAGTGQPPARGDPLRVAAETNEVRVAVDARLVWTERAAFGGWHAGIQFLPHDAAERACLVAWRDSASY